MAPRTIMSAVGIGGAIYGPGQEAALYAALGGKAPAAHLTEGDAPVLVGDWGPESDDKPAAKPAPSKRA